MAYEAPDIRLLGTVAELTEGSDQTDRPNGSVVVDTTLVNGPKISED